MALVYGNPAGIGPDIRHLQPRNSNPCLVRANLEFLEMSMKAFLGLNPQLRTPQNLF